MFSYIYSVFLVGWEILCCRFLHESFLEKRRYKNKIVYYIISVVTAVIYCFISFIFYNNLWLRQIAVMAMLSIVMYFLFESHFVKILVMTILYRGLSLTADYFMLLILGRIFPSFAAEMTESSSISVLVSVISKLSLFCIILVIRRNFGHKSEDMLTNAEWFRMLLVPAITIISLTVVMLNYNIFQNNSQDILLLYAVIGMAAMNINVFYLINDIFEREMIIRNERLFREKIKNETDMYYSISENLEKQRKRVHEFKNQIACILALANSGKYQELREYALKVDKELVNSTDMIDTKNVIVDAILNAKNREMINKGIVFVLKINDLSQIVLSDTDIVVILSNLLNNAIEACEDCQNKTIKLKFVLEDDQIIISLKNSMSKMPVRENGRFITGKTDSEDHGMGIQNVAEVIEHYGGNYVIEYEKDIFLFSILIPNIAAK